MSRADVGIGIGIITALPVECAAMRALTEDLHTVVVAGDENDYRVGRLPSADPNRPHRVVITVLPRDGNKSASAVCSDLIRSFPGVRSVIMAGIAGGVPAPAVPARHVRLGDVVVATEGIVDYDHVYTTDGIDTLRRHVNGLSTTLLRAAQELRVGEYAGRRPWEAWLGPADQGPFARPPEQTDVLTSGGRQVAHPLRRESGHPEGMPKIHHATIASADRLLRDERRRDQLAATHGVAAVEMEGAGIAYGADLHGVGWFVVRGISDYCDLGKSERWQPYASLAAAAYVRALLGVCRPVASAPPAGAPSFDGPDLRERTRLVDLLLAVPAFRDEHTRQLIIDQLPSNIAGAIGRFRAARLDANQILSTCLDYPGGISALCRAIRFVAGDAVPASNAIGALERYQ